MQNNNQNTYEMKQRRNASRPLHPKQSSEGDFLMDPEQEDSLRNEPALWGAGGRINTQPIGFTNVRSIVQKPEGADDILLVYTDVPSGDPAQRKCAYIVVSAHEKKKRLKTFKTPHKRNEKIIIGIFIVLGLLATCIVARACYKNHQIIKQIKYEEEMKRLASLNDTIANSTAVVGLAPLNDTLNDNIANSTAIVEGFASLNDTVSDNPNLLQ
ncbi:uncharacterized protein NEMAJ01_2249 [Nematocida major]|uniref:uncharacterized protein n=1 Tax=Nematocida major TaxID=1912982 RepID=UPI0020073457|nr:uncharacterized protein NEMAJ01_2249 [Nematocida major]KAH9387353.1 hypothetical protein NEMAJ01_2249 [Nematocida major]